MISVMFGYWNCEKGGPKYELLEIVHLSTLHAITLAKNRQTET